MNVENVKYEVRWHGRGGQGVVMAAQILTAAAIFKGYFAMTFPEFGPERRGAPVTAYTRIGLKRVFHREPIINPNYIIILDPSLLYDPLVFEGANKDTVVIVNYPRPPEPLKDVRERVSKILYVDATGVALKTLGKPIVNTAILGALVREFTLISLDDLRNTLGTFFHGSLLKLNIDAMINAYNEVKVWG